VGVPDLAAAHYAALGRAARVRLREAERENVPVDFPFYDANRMSDDHLAVRGPIEFADEWLVVGPAAVT
jgi:hypothetical protein